MESAYTLGTANLFDRAFGVARGLRVREHENVLKDALSETANEHALGALEGVESAEDTGDAGKKVTVIERDATNT